MTDVTPKVTVTWKVSMDEEEVLEEEDGVFRGSAGENIASPSSLHEF